MKLIGYEFSQGEFTDRTTKQVIKFDNVYLYFLKESPMCHGICTAKPKKDSQYKIKRVVLENAVKNHGFNSLDDLLKKDIELYFNEFGQVVDVLNIK